MIKVSYLNEEYQTQTPFKSFVWLVAVKFFKIDSGLAREIADLVDDLYVDSYDVNGIALTDYICENYDDLPDDYNEIKEHLRLNLEGY